MIAASNPRSVRLIERVATSLVRVDRAAGVLHGVKVLGRQSRNGRRYLPAALRAALRLYEGAKVNINHPERGGGKDRAVTDRFGVLRRVRLEADGIRADLHYLTRHPLAEMIAEAAERMPEALGLSHNAEGRTARRGGVETVEEITRVVSVDLVSDPATTGGLFESLSAGHYDRELDGRTLVEAVSATGGPTRVRPVR
jgi:hypothetical protein